MAHADYEFAQAYRQATRDFARRHLHADDSFLFSAEWGLRYYLTEMGGRIMAEDAVAQPGELVVKSQNCASQTFDHQLDRSLEVVDRETYWISSPLRLLDSRAKAGFWSDGCGVLPFWFANRALDEIIVYRVGKSYKPLTGPAATEKIWLQVTSFTLGSFHPSQHAPRLLCNSAERVRGREKL